MVVYFVPELYWKGDGHRACRNHRKCGWCNRDGWTGWWRGRNICGNRTGRRCCRNRGRTGRECCRCSGNRTGRRSYRCSSESIRTWDCEIPWYGWRKSGSWSCRSCSGCRHRAGNPSCIVRTGKAHCSDRRRGWQWRAYVGGWTGT